MRCLLGLLVSTLVLGLSAPYAAAEPDPYAGSTIHAARPACKRGARLARPAAPSDGTAAPISFSADAGWFSQYGWRGQIVTDEPVLQASVTAGWKDLSVNVWGNVDLTDENGREGELTEIDYTLDWTHRFDGGRVPWSLSLGVIHYTFPDSSLDATTELYAVASVELPLTPTVSIYRDVAEIEGTYVSLDISHEIPLGTRAALALGAGIGWGDRGYNGGYWGVGDAGWNDAHLTAALPVTLGPFTITPSVTWYGLVDELVRKQARRPNNVVVGVGFGVSL